MTAEVYELGWPNPFVGCTTTAYSMRHSYLAELRCPTCKCFWPHLFKEPLNCTIEKSDSVDYDRGPLLILPAPTLGWRLDMVEALFVGRPGFMLGDLYEGNTRVPNYRTVLPLENVCRPVYYRNVLQTNPDCAGCARSKSLVEMTSDRYMSHSDLTLDVFSDEYSSSIFVRRSFFESLHSSIQCAVEVRRVIAVTR